MDVAPVGQTCEGTAHGPALAPAAVVATADGSFWCALCWWPTWADKELVFATRVGTPLEPRNVNRAWESICRAAGVRQCRIHDLRHACGTFLYAKGVDLKVIQGVLRHTRLATTSEIYVRLLEEVRGGAADTMDAVLVDLTAERERRRAAG